MAGTVTRKSNFADLETFDDFQPRATAAPVILPEEPKADPVPTADVLPEPEALLNPYPQIGSRKEKADLQRLALQSGYTINNLVEKPIPARLEPESNTFLKTVRIEVSDWNRFQRWCHANSYSHKKGFKVLTQKLPVK